MMLYVKMRGSGDPQVRQTAATQYPGLSHTRSKNRGKKIAGRAIRSGQKHLPDKGRRKIHGRRRPHYTDPLQAASHLRMAPLLPPTLLKCPFRKGPASRNPNRIPRFPHNGIPDDFLGHPRSDTLMRANVCVSEITHHSNPRR